MRHCSPFKMIIRYGINAINKQSLKNVIRCVLIVFSILLTSYYLIKYPIGYNWVRKVHPKNTVTGRIKTMPKVIVSSRLPLSAQRNPRCSYYTCFNPYRCGRNGQQRIQVYVYPLKFYVNENGIPVIRHLSNEYYRIVQTIINSKYYTPEPEQACVFVVPFDTLSQYNFNINDTSRALNSLP